MHHCTPADEARQKKHHALASHLQHSDGVHYCRCTSPPLEPSPPRIPLFSSSSSPLLEYRPPLERRMVWNDASELEQQAMLDEMQAQWLARVAEGCAHARVGLTLRGAFGGRLSTDILVGILAHTYGETEAHLVSELLAKQVSSVFADCCLPTFCTWIPTPSYIRLIPTNSIRACRRGGLTAMETEPESRS
jgi:hypothetical protein